MEFKLIKFALLISIGVFAGCKSEDSAVSTSAERESTVQKDTPANVQIPPFERDSAYAFVEKQLSFGPRNPGSDGIEQCRDWLVMKMESYGANVRRQEFTANIYTGDSYEAENIIASFNSSHPQRILLAAHYDTRFMAEEDPDEARREQPIMGADDGASGVAVLVEIARLISLRLPDIGVDIIFFDAEDQGKRGNAPNSTTTWCLGAQYWGNNPHIGGYDAEFGILLDMVGAKGAFFNKENVRGLYPHADEVHELYNKVWNLARAMGKGRYFQNRTVEGIVDDHFFVNKLTGIPMIDIINKPPGQEQGFGEHWHTHEDDIGIIDKNVLGSVGQVVTAVIYRTAAGRF